MKLLVAMIMILSASMAFGEEPKTEDAKPKVDFPWAVRNAIKDMKKEQVKARLEYEKAVKKAAKDFKKTLEKEMDKATRKADLQLALAIKGEIEKCEVVLKAGEFSNVYDEYVAGEPLEVDGGGKNKTVKNTSGASGDESVLTKNHWMWITHRLVFETNGTVKMYLNDGEVQPTISKWKMESGVLHWTVDVTRKFKLEPNGSVFRSIDGGPAMISTKPVSKK